MGQRDEDEGRDFGLEPADPSAAAAERARKIRLLARIATMLGRPIEEFFGPNPDRESEAVQEKPDGGRS